MFAPISCDVPGSDVANEFLRAVHDGMTSIEHAGDWLAELRDEGYGYLATAIERRLPNGASRAA